MVFTDNVNGKEIRYKVPNVAQIGDYTYAKNLTCTCAEFETFENRFRTWHCDGVYDSHIGLLICFTCKNCGEKFCFHLRDNTDCYIALGCFNEYIEK